MVPDAGRREQSSNLKCIQLLELEMHESVELEVHESVELEVHESVAARSLHMRVALL